MSPRRLFLLELAKTAAEFAVLRARLRTMARRKLEPVDRLCLKKAEDAARSARNNILAAHYGIKKYGK